MLLPLGHLGPWDQRPHPTKPDGSQRGPSTYMGGKESLLLAGSLGPSGVPALLGFLELMAGSLSCEKKHTHRRSVQSARPLGREGGRRLAAGGGSRTRRTAAHTAQQCRGSRPGTGGTETPGGSRHCCVQAKVHRLRKETGQSSQCETLRGAGPRGLREVGVPPWRGSPWLGPSPQTGTRVGMG